MFCIEPDNPDNSPVDYIVPTSCVATPSSTSPMGRINTTDKMVSTEVPTTISVGATRTKGANTRNKDDDSK